ncbi:MAG: class I SAM-dependent methyltransferase [Minisyncoccia bacterium]
MPFLNPQEIVKLFPLKEGMTAVDFGCGSGYFSLAMAQLVKPSGKIIALDIWQPALDALSFRAKLEGLSTIIQVKWANLELEKGSGLENESCDLVLVSNILFEIENKEVIIKEAKRILKNNGYLVIIEWYPEKLPSKEMLYPISKEEAMALVEKEGFVIERELSLGVTHYGFLAQIKKEE